MHFSAIAISMIIWCHCKQAMTAAPWAKMSYATTQNISCSAWKDCHSGSSWNALSRLLTWRCHGNDVKLKRSCTNAIWKLDMFSSLTIGQRACTPSPKFFKGVFLTPWQRYQKPSAKSLCFVKLHFSYPSLCISHTHSVHPSFVAPFAPSFICSQSEPSC